MSELATLGNAIFHPGLFVREGPERLPEKSRASAQARPEGARDRRRRRPQRCISRRARPRRALARFFPESAGQGPGARRRARREAAHRTRRPRNLDLAGRRHSTSSSASSFSSPTRTFRQQIFSNIKKALKPGGLLLIEGYRPEQLNYKTGGPSEVENLYTRKLLEDAFKDLSSLEIEEYDSVVDEGGRHNGMSALIDLVGRK